jgi:hypothetical protein
LPLSPHAPQQQQQQQQQKFFRIDQREIFDYSQPIQVTSKIGWDQINLQGLKEFKHPSALAAFQVYVIRWSQNEGLQVNFSLLSPLAPVVKPKKKSMDIPTWTKQILIQKLYQIRNLSEP